MLPKIAQLVHDAVANPHKVNSFSARRRAARFKELSRNFPKLHKMRVLDLGGTPDFWRSSPVRPTQVTTLNLDDKHDPEEPWLNHVVADACALASLDSCVGGYDLVVSNSLIEHVGGYERRQDFARVVMAAAPAYWVQTPDRYFPIEPHYVAPGFQFLPVRARAAAVRHWPFGHERALAISDALGWVLTIELISATELQHLFPDAAIWHERICGISKSIVAVKRA